MANASMGTRSRLGLGPESGPTDREYFFSECSLRAQKAHVSATGMAGTGAKLSEQTTDGVITCSGQISMPCRSNDMTALLPYIMGQAGAANVFDFAEFPASICVDHYVVTDTIRFASTRFDTVRWSCSGANTQLMLTLGCEAKGYATGVTFPSIAGTLSAIRPFMFHQLVCTIGGTVYKPFGFDLQINWNLLKDRWQNTQNRTELPSQGRDVTITLDFPSTSDEASIRDLAVTGATGTFVFTFGALVLTFTTQNLTAPHEGVAVTGPNGEILLRKVFTARLPVANIAATVKELSITNV